MDKNKVLEIVKSIIESILLGVIIALIIIKFICMSVTVVGSSMHPTLEEGQRGLSFVIAKNFGINRFDVVVIKKDEVSELLVKRVIGLPNETVEYIDNKLYINGEYIPEVFLDDSAVTNDFKYELDDDEYFCMGDNRIISKDSRFYGPFSNKQIVSKDIFVIYPFNQIGLR